MENRMTLKLPAIGKNESLARSIVAAFAVELNPTTDELGDIKTAVSEAVTNSIVHGYPNRDGEIEINAIIDGETLHIEVLDRGIGIPDIETALQPFYTTKESEERSGMGFTVMESFMDNLSVENRDGGGLKVTMEKSFERKIAGD